MDWLTILILGVIRLTSIRKTESIIYLFDNYCRQLDLLPQILVMEEDIGGMI